MKEAKGTVKCANPDCDKIIFISQCFSEPLESYATDPYPQTFRLDSAYNYSAVQALRPFHNESFSVRQSCNAQPPQMTDHPSQPVMVSNCSHLGFEKRDLSMLVWSQQR